MSRSCKCSRSRLPSSRSREKIRLRYKCPFHRHYLQPVPSAVLDGSHYSQHVRTCPMCVLFLYFMLNRKPLPIVTVGFSYMINRMPHTKRPSPMEIIVAVSVQVFASVVLRAEVSLLVGFLVFQCFLSGWMTLVRLLKVCFIAGLLSVGSYYPNLNYRYIYFAFSDNSCR